jgi:uncharacterized protein YecE (DUF72 family)
MNLSLFGGESELLADRLRPKLADLARRGILVGTSSWKYPGWLGQIYSPERYATRGRFSPKRFEAECLREYAETFPTVCGDFAFYQFPTPEFWAKLFASAPPPFEFAFKVPEQITVPRFPTHARYGPRAGELNPDFLSVETLAALFCEPLLPYQTQVGVLIFEFGTFAKERMPSGEALVELLDPFLAALPRPFRYAVEIRNAEFLTAPYFACLARHNVAHVFNSWTRMPALASQILLPHAFTADFAVVRALLRPGRSYEEAVKRFAPYASVQPQDVQPAVRAALRDLLDQGKRGYFYVNNRLEGNAPLTIESILD